MPVIVVNSRRVTFVLGKTYLRSRECSVAKRVIRELMLRLRGVILRRAVLRRAKLSILVGLGRERGVTKRIKKTRLLLLWLLYIGACGLSKIRYSKGVY